MLFESTGGGMPGRSVSLTAVAAGPLVRAPAPPAPPRPQARTIRTVAPTAQARVMADKENRRDALVSRDPASASRVAGSNVHRPRDDVRRIPRPASGGHLQPPSISSRAARRQATPDALARRTRGGARSRAAPARRRVGGVARRRPGGPGGAGRGRAAPTRLRRPHLPARVAQRGKIG